MELFFAINNKYTDILMVCLISILENNKNENLTFNILTNDLTDENKEKLANLHDDYKNFEIKYHSPQRELFSSLKLNIEHISLETYFRYIIADMFPHLDKCLYLDADICVNNSIKELYDTDLEDFYCAGVEDLTIKKLNYKQTLDFKNTDLYVNAGVLLLNLKKMREGNISNKLFENTKLLENKIKYQDQDIINYTFKGKIKQIDSIYNFAAENNKAERHKYKDVAIIHYTGSRKPWLKYTHNKLKRKYYQYTQKAEKYGSNALTFEIKPIIKNIQIIKYAQKSYINIFGLNIPI